MQLIKRKFTQKDFIEILRQNESPNLPQILPFLKVWGFDQQNIRDFYEVFMAFGVHEQDFNKLLKKVKGRFTKLGIFNSLLYVTD